LLLLCIFVEQRFCRQLTERIWTWYFGEALKAMGLEIVNSDIKGRVHQDRKVLTGDSPFAANALGQLAAKALLGI
jgi:molecular chaperone Hsp31 and glyoxalase 3